MTKDEKKRLQSYIDRIAQLRTNKKELDDEINELVAEANEQTGINKRVIKQLAKERNWSEVERGENQLIEESLDECRHALGMLLDTPLGEAAVGKSHLEVVN